MPRIMAIDYGEKRIGIACSDALHLAVHPVATLSGKNKELLFRELAGIIAEYEVEKVIVGLPLNMNGSYSRMTHQTQKFAEALSLSTAVPVELWDERLSSYAAENIFIEEGIRSPKKKKQHIDALAAGVILSSYLASLKK